jgi:hypothetical protein
LLTANMPRAFNREVNLVDNWSHAFFCSNQPVVVHFVDSSRRDFEAGVAGQTGERSMSVPKRRTITIIGAGQAGAQAVMTLRAGGFDGRLFLIGEEGHPPYQRPPLSKRYLTGDVDHGRLALLPETFFDENEVTCEFSNAAIRLDVAGRRIELADGAEIAFDQALIATGSKPRRLAVAGAITRVSSRSATWRMSMRCGPRSAGMAGRSSSAAATSA